MQRDSSGIPVSSEIHQPENRRFRFGKFMKKLYRYVLFWVAVWLVFNCLFMVVFIPSGSMKNTLNEFDCVLAVRYGKEEIERYDIVVFHSIDEPDKYMIKRVIGLGGETIEVKNGSVYADGVKLRDDFILEKMNSDGDGTYEVPEGCCFVMGDNRNESYDSRYWNNKYVPLEKIEAKAELIFFPLSDMGFLRTENMMERGMDNE